MEKIIKDLTDFIETNSDKYFAHPGDRFINRNALLDHLEQLKSSLPKPVEVPEVKQCVADWYEGNKGDLDFAIWEYCKCWEDHENNAFHEWMNEYEKSIETLIRMKDGYTVVKEPLYYVKVGNLVFVDWQDSFVAKFATTDSLEWTDHARKIPTKDGADNIARIVGGEVVPV